MTMFPSPLPSQLGTTKLPFVLAQIRVCSHPCPSLPSPLVSFASISTTALPNNYQRSNWSIFLQGIFERCGSVRGVVHHICLIWCDKPGSRVGKRRDQTGCNPQKATTHPAAEHNRGHLAVPPVSLDTGCLQLKELFLERKILI